MNLEERYSGKSVFVTGHTGFKGSWLTELLLLLGARVTGYSLAPPTTPALFTQLRLRDRVAHFEADIRRGDYLRQVLVETRPDFVFHLAAQPIVRIAHARARETYDVNVMGTISVLEALRAVSHRCAAVFVTTDKCYAEKAGTDGYREGDALGGSEPYGSSKAAGELAIAAYRQTYFSGSTPVLLASARAGNVLGGGDWAADRIVPDSIRFLLGGQCIAIRNPSAIRPWQYILDPLIGYLELGGALSQELQARERSERLPAGPSRGTTMASAFNFGPGRASERTVRELVEEILKHWPGSWHEKIEQDAPPEALTLRLVTDKALRLLGWAPTYDFQETVRNTVDWYRESATFTPGDIDRFVELTQRQIVSYLTYRKHKG